MFKLHIKYIKIHIYNIEELGGDKMQKILPKQAIYINRLTYILYCLDGKKNANILIPYEKAIKLSYDVAKDIIDELKKEIYNKEFEVLLLKKLKKDEDLMIFPKIILIDNFKKIEKVKVDIEKERAEIITKDNQVINLNQDKILNFEGREMTYKGLFNTIQNAINFDIGFNIYKTPKGIVVGLESDFDIFDYRNKIRHYNKILDITENKIPVKIKDKKLFDESFTRLLDLIKIRDVDLFNELIVRYAISLMHLLNSVYYKAKGYKYFTVLENFYEKITLI